MNGRWYVLKKAGHFFEGDREAKDSVCGFVTRSDGVDTAIETRGTVGPANATGVHEDIELCAACVKIVLERAGAAT